ncbi:hypothetical protein SPRG_06956 [Saprolegnia parasitica CBS 223.65]|uniref:Rab-GAP TBC domain-containing protein n=1 Tax=Saprolegnia parasitica (strain CBS 223.65) TaxID=695850 RepID=A0A067CDW2_SAPPC|nr:hypothetical protein SPRG_06956 [Saprolegnia parasitica CBS 223.65]KDO27370.1 hypothetical protein SPRG_06956 [Saprolegnia parasitica CBS 223.65]|eukprot:XP_012201811.1 hypothetical protein SPRG_06956 [Saprolegnia parasitica CBS 223.65]
MSFFESIARSLGAWMAKPPPAAPVCSSEMHAPESALKKYKIDASGVYTGVYGPPSGPSMRRQVHPTARSSACDAIDDDLVARFQRHVRVSRQPEWAAGRRILSTAKARHAASLAEYTRHLAELDGHDPSQRSGLAKLQELVRDLSLLGPREAEKLKCMDRLEKLVDDVVRTGNEAVVLLVRELQALHAPMTSLKGATLHIFSLLSARDVASARLVARTWHDVVASKRLLTTSLRTPIDRWRFWTHCIRRRPGYVPQCFDYGHLVAAAMADVANPHHRAIDADVRRTTFRRGIYAHQQVTSCDESDAQAMLARLLRAYAALDPEIGYCHGMTFLGSALLSCLAYNEASAFEIFAALLLHYGFRDVFRCPDLPGAKLRMYQLDCLVRVHLPHVGSALLKQKVHPQMYASGWILALFLHEASLTSENMVLILDGFLQHGWGAMLRLYVGLLSVHADQILAPKPLQALAKLPKTLNQSLIAALEAGDQDTLVLATSEPALALLAADYDPATSLMDFF